MNNNTPKPHPSQRDNNNNNNEHSSETNEPYRQPPSRKTSGIELTPQPPHVTHGETYQHRERKLSMSSSQQKIANANTGGLSIVNKNSNEHIQSSAPISISEIPQLVNDSDTSVSSQPIPYISDQKVEQIQRQQSFKSAPPKVDTTAISTTSAYINSSIHSGPTSSHPDSATRPVIVDVKPSNLSPEDDDPNFDWNKDDNLGDVDGEEDDDDGNGCNSFCCECWIQLPNWGKTLITYSIFVIIFAIPGIVSYAIKSADPESPKVLVAEVPLYIWSLFICCCIICLGLIKYLVLFSLTIVQMNVRLKHTEKLEYLIKLRNYIMTIIWLAFVCGGYVGVVESRTNCATTMDGCSIWWIKYVLIGFIVSAIFFFAQKLLVNNIAMGFHKVAYADRLKTLQFAYQVLETLIAARKTRKVRNLYGASYGGVKRSDEGLTSGRNSPDKDKERLNGKLLLSPETSSSPKRIVFHDLDHTKADLHAEEGNASSTREKTAQNGNSQKRFLRKNFRKFFGEAWQTVAKIASAKSLPFGASGDTSNNKESDTSSQNSPSNNDNTHTARQFVLAKGFSDMENLNDEARRIARKLFEFLSEGNNWLVIEHFRPHFSKKTVDKVFALFDKNGNGSISKREMKDTVVEIFKERRSIHNSLLCTEDCLAKLDLILMVFTTFILLFVWLAIFSINISSIFLTFTSMIVATTFIIGNSAKTAFESIIFLFVTHAYDVGDRVQIDNENYTVLKIHILTTVLRRGDGMYIYASNAVLATKFISNYRRSKDMTELLAIEIAMTTPTEKISEFRARVTEYMKSKPNEFTTKGDVVTTSFEGTERMKLLIIAQNKGNWQDGSIRSSRRLGLMLFIQSMMSQLGIQAAPLWVDGFKTALTQVGGGGNGTPPGYHYPVPPAPLQHQQSWYAPMNASANPAPTPAQIMNPAVKKSQ